MVENLLSEFEKLNSLNQRNQYNAHLTYFSGNIKHGTIYLHVCVFESKQMLSSIRANPF